MNHHRRLALLIEGQLSLLDVQVRDLSGWPLLLGAWYLGEQLTGTAETQGDARAVEVDGVGRFVAQHAQGGEVRLDIVNLEPRFTIVAFGVSADALHRASARQTDVAF